MNQRMFLFLVIPILVIVLALLVIWPHYSSVPETGVSGVSTSSVPDAGMSLSPKSGPVGTVVTIHGSDFPSSSITVLMDEMVGVTMKNISSSDGKTVTFTIPKDLAANCKQGEMCPQYLAVVRPRAYTVSITWGDITKNVGTFTVTQW